MPAQPQLGELGQEVGHVLRGHHPVHVQRLARQRQAVPLPVRGVRAVDVLVGRPTVLPAVDVGLWPQRQTIRGIWRRGMQWERRLPLPAK